MLNSLLYAASFIMFKGEIGGGGRTVERFWHFREISRTLVKRKNKNRVKKSKFALNVNTSFIQRSHSIEALPMTTMLAIRVIADGGGISNKSGEAVRRIGNNQALLQISTIKIKHAGVKGRQVGGLL